MPDCQNCVMAERMANIEKQKAETHAELFKRIGQLEINTAVTNEKVLQLSKDVEKTNEKMDLVIEKLEMIAERPTKRWDKAVAAAISATISAIITAAIGYFISKPGG